MEVDGKCGWRAFYTGASPPATDRCWVCAREAPAFRTGAGHRAHPRPARFTCDLINGGQTPRATYIVIGWDVGRGSLTP